MEPFIKRLLTVLASLFLLAFVGYQAYQLLYSPIQTESVNSYSVYATEEATGFVIRNETVIADQSSGVRFYTVENGSRVPKGGEIARVFPTENDAWSQQRLDSLDEEISLLEEIESQGTANRVNLDLINKQINERVNDLVVCANTAAYQSLRDLYNDLLSLMNKRQITTGKVADFSDRIAALKAERQQLAASFKKATGTVSAPVAGYFVSEVDGMETALSYDKAEQLTTADIQAALEKEAQPVREGVAGKIVGDYEWYLACVLEKTQVTKIQEGTSLSLRLPFVSNDSIPVTVVSTNRDKEGKVAVVFRCAYMSEELSDIRREPVEIQVDKPEGLRVPNSALYFDEDGTRGVYVREGNTLRFRKVEILYSTPSYSICKEMEDRSYVRLYDDVVVKGKGLYDGKIIR